MYSSTNLLIAAPWREKLSHLLLHTGRTVTFRETSPRAAGSHGLLLPHTG